MLQLLYHAPPYVCRLAASLLPSFKSTHARPQLSELVTDTRQDAWIRIYSLRAYTAAPGDHLADHFQPLVQQTLTAREENLTAPVGYRNYLSVTQPDLLDSFSVLADKHPSNRSWFFASIRDAHPCVAVGFLKSSLHFMQSDDFREQLVNLLLEILTDHLDCLTLSVVNGLLSGNRAEVWDWLDEHFDDIMRISLANPQDRSLTYVARRWPRLGEALKEQIDDWNSEPDVCTQQLIPERKRRADDYQESPAYQYLIALSERAQAADGEAYQKLLSIGQHWQGNIPLRAAATYFVGRLRGSFDAYPFLVRQLLYGDVKWDINSFDSPIRFEAGEALLAYPTPQTWEAFVDSAFIQPRDDFKSIQHDWIAYLTDVLSGEKVEYKSRHFRSEADCPWFRALAEISEDALQQEVGSR